MRLYLTVDRPGLTLKIPGLVEMRTPVKVDISKLNLSTIISELKRQGIENFTIEYGDKTKKKYTVESNDKKEIPITVTNREQIVDERLIQKILEDFKKNSNPDENLFTRLDKIESLIQLVLQKDLGKETIVTKDSSSKKYQQDDDDELDFIPNVNINKMTSKGTPKTTIISTSSNDINETMEALKKVTKKE